MKKAVFVLTVAFASLILTTSCDAPTSPEATYIGEDAEVADTKRLTPPGGGGGDDGDDSGGGSGGDDPGDDLPCDGIDRGKSGDFLRGISGPCRATYTSDFSWYIPENNPDNYKYTWSLAFWNGYRYVANVVHEGVGENRVYQNTTQSRTGKIVNGLPLSDAFQDKENRLSVQIERISTGETAVAYREIGFELPDNWIPDPGWFDAGSCIPDDETKYPFIERDNSGNIIGYYVRDCFGDRVYR